MRVVSAQDVCRLAICRQYLDKRTAPDLYTLIQNLGCVQLDPINAVERSHLLVLWSRLGGSVRDELDNLLWEEQKLFEYWAHCASIVLTDEYPIHAYRMQNKAEKAEWGSDLALLRDYIVAELTERGSALSRDIDQPIKLPKIEHAWYSARMVPRVLETLWEIGDVMVVGRNGRQRIWGLTSQHLPDWTPQIEWTESQITHFAAQKAIRALGIATPQQIKKHYTRGRYPKLTQILYQLLSEQRIEQVTVEKDGEPLKGKWFVHTADIPLLAKIQAGEWEGKTVLLSPFDNLICDRKRTELLWDFFYRIEIYVPKAKRQYGYYVLPILHGDRFIGRINPTMNRKTGKFHVHNIYWERDVVLEDALICDVEAAVAELAQFLGATEIVWEEGQSCHTVT